MKVTICELSNRDRGFVRDWDILVRHVRKHESDLVLLPEMTFYPWFAWTAPYASAEGFPWHWFWSSSSDPQMT